MASRAKRRCKGCNQIVSGACQACMSDKRKQADKQRSQDEQRRENKSVYNNKQWARVRAEVYGRDAAICGICGLHVPPAEYDCDHKIPLGEWQGDPFDADNLQVAHRSCHSGKTSGEVW